MRITTSDTRGGAAASKPRRDVSRPVASRFPRRLAAGAMLLVLALVSMSPVALLCWHASSPVPVAEVVTDSPDEHAHHGMPAPPRDGAPPAPDAPAPGHGSHGMPNDCLRHCASAPVVALPGISAAIVAIAPIAVPARVEARATQRPAAPARLLPFANGPPSAEVART